MREIHEGICGNHSGARALQKKIVRASYYWPSMQADTNRFVQHCDKCQRFGNLLHSPPEVLVPMAAPWPFAQWGLDIMGPFPIFGGCNRLLHQMDGSRTTGNYYRKEHSKLRMEGSYLQVRNSTSTRIRQRKTVRQSKIQTILPRVRYT